MHTTTRRGFLGWLAKGLAALHLVPVLQEEPDLTTESIARGVWESYELQQPCLWHTPAEFIIHVKDQLTRYGHAYVWKVPNVLGKTIEVHCLVHQVTCAKGGGYLVQVSTDPHFAFLPAEQVDRWDAAGVQSVTGVA